MSKPRTRIEKGKRAEKEVCSRIERAGLGKARREAGSGNGKNKGDIFTNLDFLIEVKNQKTIKYQEWIKQAREQARIGNYDSNKWALVIVDPAGIQVPERMDIYVTIELDEWLHLLKKNQEPRTKEPDRELKYLLESAKEMCHRIERDETDIFLIKRLKLISSKIIKALK